MSGMAQHQAPNDGATVEWYTPPAIFDALRLSFDLDPCAPPLPAADWIPAARRYTARDDGLTQPWAGRVWLNPPYGRDAAAWMDRLAAHGDGIALVFARTDTAWWHRVAPRADLICFIAGRIAFIDPTGYQDRRRNAGAPSALLAFGAACADAVQSSKLGLSYVPAPSVGDGEREEDR